MASCKHGNKGYLEREISMRVMWSDSSIRLTKCFGDVDSGHRVRTLEQNVCVLTVLPSVAKY